MWEGMAPLPVLRALCARGVFGTGLSPATRPHSVLSTEVLRVVHTPEDLNPDLAVLETAVLPLHQAYMKLCVKRRGADLLVLLLEL